ncbi:hypothetical protein QFC19_008753 [Naganishia cerealis]|uniref:Uncharacterized protein n=1 Tax=Naganishia cerealis TaxID=610337 RepID=A0ACC2UZ16_9TREE|nr:hypothetical protein QFC19_008753 [Naganishia cerealis]
MPPLTATVHEFSFPTRSDHHDDKAGADLASFPIPSVDDLFSNADGDWSGWTWDRPRTTWIEPRHLPAGMEDVDPYIASHLLLLTHRTPQSTKGSTSNGVVALYPVCSKSVHATLSAGRKEENEPTNALFLRVRKIASGRPREQERACVVVVRADNERTVHQVVERAVLTARMWLRGMEEGRQVTEEEIRPFIGLEDTSPLQGVGFCTWSSIGEGVKPNTSNLTHLLTSLADAHLPIQSFMLDDGWLDTRHYIDSANGTEYDGIPGWNAALWAFEAAPSLGTTMGGVVQLIKEKLPSVKDVGVWMTLEGYWKAIHPDSPLARKYRIEPYALDRAYMPGITNEPGNVSHLPTGHGTWFLPHPDDAFAFWRDWFTYLREQGVTWVKVDNQASLSFVAGVRGAEAHTGMWEGMTRAAEEVWGAGRVVYCMSHSERMYNGDAALGVASQDKKLVVRNSDDFGLEWRYNAHQLHIFYNVYTAILTSHLAHVPDADMFMTAAQHPLYHALLRAVFPGPLLLSDKPNQHDQAIISSLLARDKKHQVHVVKAKETPAKPLANRVFPVSPQDIDVPVGKGDGTATIAAVAYPDLHAATIAAWNTRDTDQPGATRDTITRVDVFDALELPVASGERAEETNLSGSYVLYRQGYAKGLPVHDELRQVSVIEQEEPMNGKGDVMSFTLEHTTCEAFTVSELHSLKGSSGKGVRVAPLGLVDKLAGLSGLKSVHSTQDSVICDVIFDGTLGFIVLGLQEVSKRIQISVDGEDVAFEHTQVKLVGQNTKQTSDASLVILPIKQGETEGESWTVRMNIV